MQRKLLTATFSLLFLGTSLLSIATLAQEPASPSVAEAARRARTQKQNAAKPSKVITDDTLHPQSANPAVQTETMPSSEPAASQSSADAGSSSVSRRSTVSAPEKSQADTEAEQKKELEALKPEIAAKEAEIDLAQREFALANDSYYSKPDFSSDKAGKARLDGMQSDLNAKKDELAKLKARFAELGGVAEPKPNAPPAPMVPARP